MRSLVAFVAVATCTVAMGAAVPLPARRPEPPARPSPTQGRSWPRPGPLRWSHARDRQRDAALPGWLSHLATAVRAGQALGPAIISTADAADHALRPDLRRMAEAMRHGASAQEALERWQASRSSAAVALATRSLTLALHTGGPVARSVDAVAATLRDRQHASAEARAMGAQARASAWVLIAAPPVFTALVACADSSLAGFLVTTRLGVACLVGGLSLDAAGAVWMAHITSRVAT